MKADIYYKPTCPYCHKAMEILDHQDIAYTMYDISLHPEKREEMIERMGDRASSGKITVPQIFIDRDDGRGYIGIGGYDDLYKLYVDNQL